MRRCIIRALMAIGVIGANAGCNQSSIEQPNEADSMESLAYTLYTDKTELFVEFKPLIVGQTSRFAAHLTRLGESFKPLTSGKVSVRLQPLEKGTSQQNQVDGPSSPGIFRPELTPKQAGRYRLVFHIETDSYLDSIRIDTIQVFANRDQAHKAATPEAVTTNEITYLKEQAWKVDFANQALTPEPFGKVFHASATVQPAPTDDVVLSATFDGIVQMTDRPLAEGQSVQSGQRLVVLSSRSLSEKNLDTRTAQAQIEFDRARLDYQRAQQLAGSQLITDRDFQLSKAQYESARTALQTLTSTYQTGGKTLTAPMDGYLRELLVKPGQFVSAGQPLLSITRNRRLLIRVDVPMQHALLLPQIQTVNLWSAAEGRLYQMSQLNGRIVSYGRSAISSSAFTSLLMEVNNVSGLLPGMVVDVWLQTIPEQKALVVPESALIEEQGQYYVYVQTEGESFEKRQVQLGARNGKQAQLLSGAQAGERVVTKGAYQIRLSSLSGTLPAHGHEH